MTTSAHSDPEEPRNAGACRLRGLAAPAPPDRVYLSLAWSSTASRRIGGWQESGAGYAAGLRAVGAEPHVADAADLAIQHAAGVVVVNIRDVVRVANLAPGQLPVSTLCSRIPRYSSFRNRKICFKSRKRSLDGHSTS